MRLPRLVAPFLGLALVAPAPAAASWEWPVRGPILTRYLNGADPYARGQHRGIDIAAPAGTPVVAAAGGRVRFAGTVGSSGLTVSIRSRGLDTSYLHLGSVRVTAGQRVRAGQAIGSVGTTGRRSHPAPHLHFGVREADTRHGYRDPLTLLPTRAARPRPRPAPPAPVPVRAPRPRAPRAVPAARRAPVPRLAPRFAPAPIPMPGPAPTAVPAARREPAAGRAPPLAALIVALAGALLAAAALGTPPARRLTASSIGRRWPTTSRHRSTT